MAGEPPTSSPVAASGSVCPLAQVWWPVGTRRALQDGVTHFGRQCYPESSMESCSWPWPWDLILDSQLRLLGKILLLPKKGKMERGCFAPHLLCCFAHCHVTCAWHQEVCKPSVNRVGISLSLALRESPLAPGVGRNSCQNVPLLLSFLLFLGIWGGSLTCGTQHLRNSCADSWQEVSQPPEAPETGAGQTHPPSGFSTRCRGSQSSSSLGLPL